MVAALTLLLLAVAPVAATPGWTGPLRVGNPTACTHIVAAIDAAGRFHLAAECGGRIRYSSSEAGASWSSTFFAHPTGSQDLDPQIAIDGNVLYVAYSRKAGEDCSGRFEAGVYYRHRLLPGGAWSGAVRLGSVEDSLQSFRVVAGTLHATVHNNHDEHLYYETSRGGVVHRHLIVDGAGPSSSLRVGSDGLTRIVYQGQNGLRYAVFTGSAFRTSSIPGTTSDDQFPLLVLDAANHAHVTWIRTSGPGCAQRDPQPDDGTYYATNRTGAWSTGAARRITALFGPTSLTVDTASGRVHILTSGFTSSLRYWTKSANGRWTGLTLASTRAVAVAIRLDQSRGVLLAAYVAELADGSGGSVYVLTKP
jgi:hypothetical protein